MEKILSGMTSLRMIDGTESNTNHAVSLRDPTFVYAVGKLLRCLTSIPIDGTNVLLVYISLLVGKKL